MIRGSNLDKSIFDTQDITVIRYDDEGRMSQAYFSALVSPHYTVSITQDAPAAGSYHINIYYNSQDAVLEGFERGIEIGDIIQLSLDDDNSILSGIVKTIPRITNSNLSFNTRLSLQVRTSHNKTRPELTGGAHE